MLREVNECVSGKKSDVMVTNDSGQWLEWHNSNFGDNNIDSIVAITILRLRRDWFQTWIFEVKTKCSIETRYVGICQISTKGVKKMGNTHGLKRAGLANIWSHPQAITLAMRGLEEPFFQLCFYVSFFVLAGNRFWFYILLMYLEYHTVVVLC